MSHKTNRREFLAQSAGAAAGAAAVSLLPGVAAAIEPIRRSGSSEFKYSLAAYSYRNLLQGKEASLTLADFIDDCAKMKLDGTELTSYYFPTPITREYLLERKEQCRTLGLEVSGTAVGNDFGHPPGEKREQQIRLVKDWVDHSAVLGAPVIRIFAGHQQKDVSAEETHKLVIEGIEECCEYAGQHGVKLALENHGGPTSTAEGLLALVRDVKSPHFGVNLDTGNFHTENIYDDLTQAAPFAINVQVKVVVAGPDGKKQPTDFGRLARILREAGYQGYIVLEYEEASDPRQECPKFMEQIRAAFA
jgi:sugar phosphate isomerase/epimerase